MTEVNKLVAFSPPLRFLCLLLFPCFPAPLTESPVRRLSVLVRSLVIRYIVSVLGVTRADRPARLLVVLGREETANCCRN